MHKIALAVARGADAGKHTIRDPSGTTAPRKYLFDEAFSASWDESILNGNLTSRVPAWWRLAREVQHRYAEYDGVVSWGEKLSLALLIQQQWARVRKPHIALMYQFEKANIRIPINLLKRNLDAVVTWSSIQRRALIERIGYPAERVYLIRHYVDQLFYSPRPAEEDTICAVGAEMRDYATLLEALRGTGVPCHVAADHVRVPGPVRFLNDRRVDLSRLRARADKNVTIGRLPLTQLRELYARSKFVVVPLLHSDTDNGVTVILEAMAMGRPVICSRTRGQVDVIEDGVTGLYVPVGDAAALRAAILSLWNDPARVKHMGRNARALVEKNHTLEKFTATARSAAEAAVAGRPAPEAFWE